MTALAAAVERAYAVFARPAPADLSICTQICCASPEDEQRILATPQRALTLDHFRDWYTAAFYYDPAPVKWLLPRILELLAEGEDPAPGGMALQRLGRCGYPEGWSAEERAVVETCVRLFAARALPVTDDPFDPLGVRWIEWLCHAAGAQIPLGPLIAEAEAAPPHVLARALSLLRFEKDLTFLHEGSWEDAAEGARAEVDAWLSSPALRTRVEAGLATETDPDWEWEIERLLDTMRGW